MNMNNKKMIGNICFLSFLKRFFILFLCIILCFNVVCKPKKTYGATLGVAVTWGLSEYLAALLASAGIALTVDTFCRGLGLYGGDDEVTEDEALQWCKNNISIDGDNNVVFTDDAKAFVNDYLLGTYKDSVTMTYRYPVQLQCVSAEHFLNKDIYDAFVAVCQQYPNSYILTSDEPVRSWRGTMYTALDGSKSDGVWDTSWDNFTEIFVIPQPLAGVSQYLDLASASTSFYDDNWEQNFKCITYVFAPDGRWFTRKDGDYNYGSSVGANWHYTNSIVEIEPFTFPSYDELTNCGAPSGSYSYATFSSSSYSTSLSARTCYSASPNALNVYKSLADMKKDIGSQVIGNFIPDYYTGTPNYNITTSEVNNVVNNYYPPDPGDNPGGGSGSDDNGGGSSGGVFDDIISGIASGVGSIIKGIFSIVKELVDAVADAIASITKSITDLSSLLKTDFTDFLSAVFPFLPQEFITILIAGLSLFLFGVTIKILRG